MEQSAAKPDGAVARQVANPKAASDGILAAGPGRGAAHQLCGDGVDTEDASADTDGLKAAPLLF